MKKKTLLYIPLLLLFAFAFSVLISHYSKMPQRIGFAASEYLVPFNFEREVKTVRAEAEKEGLRLKDKFLTVNGKPITSDESYREEMQKAERGLPLNLTVQRQTDSGQTETLNLTITPIKVVKDLNFYSKFVVLFLVSYFLPTLCVLLGFWVVFVRPRDYLAWLLLFLLLGVSSTGLVGSVDPNLVDFS